MSHQQQQVQRQQQQGDGKDQEEEQEGEGDRVSLLALMTEYLAITYKHCRQQQQQTQQKPQYHRGSEQQSKPQGSIPTASEHQSTRVAHSDTAPASTPVSTPVSTPASRRILTKKAEPAGNGGLDNEDRNLIVRVRDILGDDSDARANSSSDRATSSTAPARYVVLDLLGQGTFGQVFRCQHLVTKHIVAVKVIRNHPSYYKQAIVEVQITHMLNRHYGPEDSQHIVRLLHSFEFQSHLCLVFELLSMNVYELIAENNFTGFPLDVTQGFIRQILHALVQLADAGVIHCDLKPENILLAGQDRLFTAPTSNSHHHHHRYHLSQQQSHSPTAIPLLKVVDFGSACLENETVYSYIQSRFYRSPEVLLGIPYNGAIDMWSLGCIAFEMLLGLPLFPGVSEHDQLCLIEETLGPLPQYLLKKGRNVLKFYDVRVRQRVAGFSSSEEFVLKTPEQFAKEGSSEVRIAKKYFKYSKLADLVHAYPFRANATPGEIVYEQERRQAFLHFLNGLLVVDPAARWTAREALRHPFITGEHFVDESSGEREESILHSQSGSPPSSCYYQQQPQEQGQSTMQYAGVPHMAVMRYQQQQQMPIPQRVCPINAYYLDASDPYYNGGEPLSSYAYNQPWVPAYAPFSMGDDGNYVYNNSNSLQQADYEYPSQLQSQFCWDVPPCESFQPPVSRTKQKVTPVPPTGSLVIPMHSPVYSFPPRPEFQYLQQQQMLYTYDPSFMLPLECQHPISVAPMDHQQFRTPPKPHHHHNHNQQSHKATSAHRSTRRRRQTQPRIPETGLSLPNLSPLVYANDSTHQLNSTGVNSRGSARHAKPVGTANHHHRVHKSKRRNESSNDASEPAQRPWKSPRATSDHTVDGGSARDGQQLGRAPVVAEPEERLEEEHGGDVGGCYWIPPSQVTPQIEEDVYFPEASFASAIQCSLATPALPLPT